MAAYFFMFATIIAVLAIAFIFKIYADKIKANPEAISQYQTRFFIWVALSEAFPILLVVLGMMNQEKVGEAGELMIPALIIIIFMAFSLFFIFLQTMVDVNEDLKEKFRTFAMIGVSLSMSIPIISCVGLLLMLP